MSYSQLISSGSVPSVATLGLAAMLPFGASGLLDVTAPAPVKQLPPSAKIVQHSTPQSYTTTTTLVPNVDEKLRRAAQSVFVRLLASQSDTDHDMAHIVHTKRASYYRAL